MNHRSEQHSIGDWWFILFSQISDSCG